MTTKLKELQEAALVFTGKAREIAEKASDEGRGMADGERSEFEQHMAKAREKYELIKVVKADEAVLAEAKALAEQIGVPTADDVAAQAQGGVGDRRSMGHKSLGELVIGSKQFGDMLKQLGVGDGRDRIPENTRVQSAPIPVQGLFGGSKALWTGASDTSGGAFVVAEQTGIVESLGRRELKIRDLISVRRTGSDTVEYVAQTSHTNNAAPVAEATSSAAPTTGASSGAALTLNAGGGYKPEGAWAYERRTAVVKTIAEWVPATKRSLADVAALEGLINDELRADIAEAEETQIISGSGSGENLTGVLNWSGTQSQTFSTDIFQTSRKAITKAQTVGRVNPTAFVFSPGDVEKIDLMKDSDGRYFGAGPFAMGPRTLWGYPYLASEALSDGTGVLADWKKVVLWDREETTVTMTDSHADFFIRNLVAILAEERVAMAVTRPSAIVEMATA